MDIAHVILINTLICISIYILSYYGLFQLSNANIPFFIFNIIILIILMILAYQYSIQDKKERNRPP